MIAFVTCERCGGEGRLYGGHPNDPEPSDYGTCPVCQGTGEDEVELCRVTEEEIMEPTSERCHWRCRSCDGLFLYPIEAVPNFCPYCRSRDLVPLGAP